MPFSRFSSARPAFILLVVPLVLVTMAGCSSGKKMYPVRGKILWPDGSGAKELASCTVVFQCSQEQVSSQGQIDEEGGFVLDTYQANDGTVAGTHKVVLVMPFDDIGRKMQIVHPRYEKFDTSGLEVTVEPKDNEVVLKVEPGPWMKKQKR
jgi:hypothetical protein